MYILGEKKNRIMTFEVRQTCEYNIKSVNFDLNHPDTKFDHIIQNTISLLRFKTAKKKKIINIT